MAPIKNHINYLIELMRHAVIDDTKRRNLLCFLMTATLSAVSLFMSAVNWFTNEHLLMVATLTYGVLCFLDAVLIRRGGDKITVVFFLFAIETLALLSFFLISGIPNGFSALWTCLVPTFCLLVFGIKTGVPYSLVTFLVIIFLFWTPVGQNILHFKYTDEFLLRFPFFYIACFMMALFIEMIRAETQKQLEESRAEYAHLYRHDALTGLYNRYGFNKRLDEIYLEPEGKGAAVLIMDIDNFKNVNDRYGHSAGDEVLRQIAAALGRVCGDSEIFCRWGGEEFTVFSVSGTDSLTLAENIRKEIENTSTVYEEDTIRVTASLGLCVTDAMGDVPIARMVNTADKCLYRSKAEGKNRLTWEKLP